MIDLLQVGSLNETTLKATIQLNYLINFRSTWFDPVLFFHSVIRPKLNCTQSNVSNLDILTRQTTADRSDVILSAHDEQVHFG